jgi:hypothetical protein
MSFPVPEGIFNYQGSNTVSLTLWALDGGGAKLSGLSLVATRPVQSDYGPVALMNAPAYSERSGAY